MLDDLMQTKRAKENAFLAMIASGAKGKIMNLQSILTCVGQVVVNGARVHRSIAQGRPFYLEKKDTLARHAGFLKSTYSRGISAQEIIGSFFAGRESVVDTGINTSRTGYAYRRIIKGIENQRIALDGSVRDGQYIV
jgi:DNA-directed RNA polymerase beta' subunit